LFDSVCAVVHTADLRDRTVVAYAYYFSLITALKKKIYFLIERLIKETL